MARLRRQKIWLVWLMTIAVIGNVAAAATCCWPARAHAGGDLSDILGALVICTASGAKTLAANDTGTPTPSHAHQNCSMCVLVAAVALGLLTFNLLGILRPQGPSLRLDWRRTLPVRNFLAQCGFLSRGPPLTV